LFLALTVSDATAVAEMRPAGATASYRTSDPFADFVEEASRRFGVPVHLICAVIYAESAGDARARSPKGAMGLMQIMPNTWAELRLRYDLGNDPYDPHDNILAGTAYLRKLHDRYGSPGFLAAYNAGPARYEEHLAGRPLPAETQAYLQKLAPVIGSDIAACSAVAPRRSSAAALFTSAAAGFNIDVEQNVLTGQVIGQRPASRRCFGRRRYGSGAAFLNAADIAVDIFQCERQLVGIKALLATPELRALKLFDDCLKTLDLAVSMLNCHGDVAHQAMQKCRIRQQIVEIELHVRFYSNMLIRRSNFAIFYAGFCDSARDGGAPSTLGCAPIDAFDQHRKLRWRQRRCPPGSLILGQMKPP
jgi:hypothetical protein